MKILAIESSATASSVAVSVDGVLKAEEFAQNGLTHSETLLPSVSHVLKRAGIDIEDIDLFSVTCGPGSFSGLRIGVATTKGLAYASGKKAVGVSTLEAIAYNLPYSKYLVCPIMDARRDQLYTALYKWSGEGFDEIVPPSALSAAELVSKINDDVIFIGDGVTRFRSFFEEELKERAHFAPYNLCAAKAQVVALLAEKKEGVDPSELNPIYLRLSQAEREYIEKHGKE